MRCSDCARPRSAAACGCCRYFGEAAAPCGNCDNCLEPPETWDATVAAQKALSAIYRTGQRFGAVHVIDVLRGKENERVLRWDHQQLGVFGIGAELDEAAWRDVFRQLVALGYVEVDHGAYGALRLTEASRPVLKGEQPVQMRRTAPRQRRTKRVRPAVGGAGALAAAGRNGGGALPATGATDPAGEAGPLRPPQGLATRRGTSPGRAGLRDPARRDARGDRPPRAARPRCTR